MIESTLIDEFFDAGRDTDDKDQTYCRLTVIAEKEMSLVAYTPVKIEIEEAMNSMVIFAKLQFYDQFGVISNATPFLPHHEFKLYIGHTPDDVRVYSLRYSNYQFFNTSLGESSNYLVSMNFVSSSIMDMKKVRSRSFRNARYSDVVGEIANECGFETSDITNTKNTFPSIIQPWVDNISFIEWLSRKSVSKFSDSFYVYSASHNGGFFFKPFDELYDGTSLDIPRSSYRNFHLAGNIDIEDSVPVVNIAIDESYIKNSQYGATGIRYGYFDYLNNRYISDETRYSDLDEPMLSEWASVSDMDGHVLKHVDGGRDDNTDQNSKSKVARMVDSLHSLRITINSVTDVPVGDKIDLLIPSNPEVLQMAFNEFSSGAYITTGKKTVIDFERGGSMTTLKISRQGYDGVEVDNMSTSVQGKVL